MRVLLVKLSSLGDVIHNCPVATDVRRAFPTAEIDWVTEAPYVDLVAMHPAIRRVHAVHLRDLKKAWGSRAAWSAVGADRAGLAANQYDLIIDTQGLIKSAIVARWAGGPVAGMDWQSAREPLASFWYQHCFSIAKDAHAVTRNRAIAAAALGYGIETDCDYGLVQTAAVPDGETRDIVFLHATSRVDKEWPVENWVTLGQTLAALGYRIVLPAGSVTEYARSEAIAAAIPNSFIPPQQRLSDLAARLARVEAVVGVDTGLSHLAVALGRPTVGLYLSTTVAHTGLFGAKHAKNLGGGTRLAPCQIEVESVLAALESVLNSI